MVNIISKFVAFKILIQIQDYYLRQRQNFQVKAAVKEPLIIKVDNEKIFGRKSRSLASSANTDEEAEKPRARMSIKVLYFVYKLIRTVFTSFYFYFFPLLYLAFPFSRLVLSNRIEEFEA